MHLSPVAQHTEAETMAQGSGPEGLYGHQSKGSKGSRARDNNNTSHMSFVNYSLIAVRRRLQVYGLRPPHRCHCRIPILNSQLTGGGPGCRHQVWSLPKLRSLGVKTAMFLLKTAPKPMQNRQTKGEKMIYSATSLVS